MGVITNFEKRKRVDGRKCNRKPTLEAVTRLEMLTWDTVAVAMSKPEQ